MPRADLMPEINSELEEVPCKTNPLGVKGIGESGTIGAPPTVINAIIDALRPLGVDRHRHAGDVGAGVGGDRARPRRKAVSGQEGLLAVRSPAYRAQVAGALARRRPASDAVRSGSSEVLRARHVSVPVGRGLHVGHCEGYTATDIVARCKRMQGFNVLHPMGWDAFGLPGRELRDQAGIHPRETTAQAIANFRRQIDADRLRLRLGARGQHDRSRLLTLDAVDLPAAVQARASPTRPIVPINWCPSCKTVLANEEVIARPLRALRHSGRARGHAPVDAADHPLRRPAARRPRRGRLAGVDAGHAAQLDRAQSRAPRSTSTSAGRRDRRRFAVFTTRPDTLFGATYMVLAPEHPLVDAADHAGAARGGRRVPRRGAPQERARAHRRSPRTKTGVFTGAYAINPVNGEQHPDLDRRLRARRATAPARSWRCRRTTSATSSSRAKFALPIRQVVRPAAGEPPAPGAAFAGDGIDRQLGHSSTAWPTPRPRRASSRGSSSAGSASARSTTGCATGCSRASATGASRFPIVHCPTSTARCRCPRTSCRCVLPRGRALRADRRRASRRSRAIADWVEYDLPDRGGPARRETNTMPQWAGSCWYYLRFLDPKNDRGAVAARGREVLDAGRPLRRRRRARRPAPAVCALLAQGAVRLGYVSTKEPFKKLRHQGMVLAYTLPATRAADYHGLTRSSSTATGACSRRRARSSTCRSRRCQSRGSTSINPDDVIARVRRRRAAALRDVHGRVRAAQAVGSPRHRGA